MERLLFKDMSIDEILAESLIAYDFCYHGYKLVPAAGSTTLAIQITNDADFLNLQITGGFTTMIAGEPNEDDGVNHISFNITDENRNIKLFNTLVPANLVFSPGRQRSSGFAGDPSNQLFYPKEFIYPFKGGGQIIIDLSNDSDADNGFWIAFWGTKFRRDI